MEPCSFEGCERIARSSTESLCIAHCVQRRKGNPLVPLYSTRHPNAAFIAEDFNYHIVDTPHGVLWTGTMNPKGYGRGAFNGKGFYAHRLAYELEYGPIPDGLEVDHDPACPKSCVTPKHLTLRTKAEHAKLGWERGQLNGGWGTKRERMHPPRPDPFAWQQERECKNCSAIFMPTTARNLHCSRKCHCQYKEELRRPRRYPRPDSMVCQWYPCGQVFTPKRRDSRFCSRKCIDANQQQKKKERRDHA